MNRSARLALFATAFAYAAAAAASESISYSYDSVGRLTTISTTTGPNAGTTITTGYDPAGNRLAYTVTGAGAAGSAALMPSENVTRLAGAATKPSRERLAAADPAPEPPPSGAAAAGLMEAAR